ncbi:MAG TPA: hypothetical protein DDZ89_07955 [Clostridiales bacterium]|nr:hypothetical protein [Clostridiales bacterium]
MLQKIKADLLRNYTQNIIDPQSSITFIEIDKEKMYDENSDSDVPFKYIQFQDGCIIFATIPKLLEFAKNYYEIFKNGLFNKKAFEYLFENISVKMKKYERKPYTVNRELEKYMSYSILDDKTDIPYEKIQNSTIQFKADTPYKNITNSYIELSQDCIYYGTLIGENIVSIVGTNTPIMKYPNSEVVYIGVETHENYRQKGYAISNVAAMSDYLLSNGYIVKWGCNSLNISSIKTASSCGFREIAKEKTVFCVGD